MIVHFEIYVPIDHDSSKQYLNDYRNNGNTDNIPTYRCDKIDMHDNLT